MEKSGAGGDKNEIRGDKNEIIGVRAGVAVLRQCHKTKL